MIKLLALLFFLSCSGSSKVPLTICCPEGEFYSLGFDKCKKAEEEEAASWPPPVYFDNIFSQSILSDVTVNDFNIKFDVMSDCAAQGKVISTNSTQFKFIQDGSLRLDDGRRFKPGEFCLNQVESSATFVARFCIPDPCSKDKNNDDYCVKKCCHNGMAVHLFVERLLMICLPNSVPFNVTFRNESGHFIIKPASYVTKYESGPKCSEGVNLLNDQNEDDTFYILTNGTIYSPNYPEKDRTTINYCLDNFVHEDDTVSYYLLNNSNLL